MAVGKNFVLIDAIPDASRIFLSKYKEVGAIKDDCIVALDTNVLLAPYKIGSSSFKSIIDIYSKLADQKRILLPAHVAREYARHRTIELSNLVKTLRDQSSRAVAPIPSNVPFLEGTEEYTKAKEASDAVLKGIKETRSLLDKVIQSISNPVTGDPILTAYSPLFSEFVYDIDIDDREIFEQNCEYRFENGIPPGYQDESKANNAIGDVIIWKTIIDFAKKHKKDVIFVTGDEKSDWWVRHDKIPFQPRYELIDEFSRETDGQTIHLLPLHRFIEVYEGSAHAVAEAEKVEREIAEAALPSLTLKKIRPGLSWNAGRTREVQWLHMKQAELEQISSRLRHARIDDPEALRIADELAIIKRRIRMLSHRFEDDGPDYSRAYDDED